MLQLRIVAGCFALLLFGSSAACGARAKDGQAQKRLSSYNTFVVQAVTVEQSAATKDFPKGLDIVMQDRIVQELRNKNVFQRVQGPGESPTEADKPAGESEKGLILNGMVLSFDKGNTAGRFFLGFGSGKSKITVRFILRDAQSGLEIMKFDQKATWNGMTTFSGGDAEDAAHGVAFNAVKEMIKEIQKNR
jgi:hypothetical protein